MWAVIIVIIAVSFLAYHGITSGKLVGRSCIIGPGISCSDFKVNEDAVTLSLQNGFGQRLSISEIQVEYCTGTNSGVIEKGDKADFIIEGCNNVADEKIIAHINITYTQGVCSLVTYVTSAKKACEKQNKPLMEPDYLGCYEA